MINEEYYYSCKYLSKNMLSIDYMSNNINLLNKNEIIQCIESATQKDFSEILTRLKDAALIASENDWQHIHVKNYNANRWHVMRIKNCNEKNNKIREDIKENVVHKIKMGNFLVEGITTNNIIQYEKSGLLSLNDLYNEASLLKLLRNKDTNIVSHVLKNKNKSESLKMLFTVISGMAKYDIMPSSYEGNLVNFISDSVTFIQKKYGNKMILENIEDLGFHTKSPSLYSVLGDDKHSLNDIKKIVSTIIEKTEITHTLSANEHHLKTEYLRKRI